MRHTSKIKWFSNLKGNGFAEPVPGSGGKDVFVHQRRFRRSSPYEYLRINEGDSVEFRLVDLGNGPLADDVVIIKVR